MLMRKNKSTIIVAVAVSIIFLAFSAFSAFAAAEHDCTGENCAICLFSSRIKQSLALVASLAFIISVLACALICVHTTFVRRSLVSNKVKLNN